MKSISKILLLVVFFSLIFTIGCEKQHDIQKLQEQVDAVNDEIVEAIMTNNQEATLKFYTEDAISLPSYQPMIRGMEALKAEVEKQKEMPMNWKSFTLTTNELWASGMFVVDIGTYEMTMEWPDAPGGVWSDTGKYMTLFEIQKDGSLLMKADTWNTDTNPWEEMMKDQEEEKK